MDHIKMRPKTPVFKDFQRFDLDQDENLEKRQADHAARDKKRRAIILLLWRDDLILANMFQQVIRQLA